MVLHGTRLLTTRTVAIALLAGTTGLTALAATGCGGANMTTYSPVSETTKYSADSLFTAARDAAEQLGYQPRAADSQGHSLDTREKQVAISSIPRLSYKYSFHLETTGGVLSITAACMKNSATSEQTFSECGDDRPERVIHEQDALKARILALAPKIEANVPDWGSFGKPEQSAGDGGAPAPAGKGAAAKSAGGKSAGGKSAGGKSAGGKSAAKPSKKKPVDEPKK